MLRFARCWPALITLGVALWMGAVTFANVYYFHYGWIPTVYNREGRETWNVTEVNEMFGTFASEGSDRIAAQLLPACLIILGSIACLVQSCRSITRSK